MMPLPLLLLSLLAVAPATAAFSVDAGLVPPLAAAVRTVSVTSNPAASANIIDSSINTQWQSGACFPSGFISRTELNPVLNACVTAGRCTASAGSTLLRNATDASFYTGASIRAVNGSAWVRIPLLTPPSDVYRLYFRGNWGKAGTATVTLVSASGVRTLVATVTSATNWVDQVVVGAHWQNVASVEVANTEAFTLTELALQGARCFEQAIVDMQAVQTISVIRARWWSPDAAATSLLISEDGVTWTTLRDDLLPNALPVMEFNFEQPLRARFLSVCHMVKEELSWGKVYMWELSAYGAGGRWGLPPPPAPAAASYRQLLGLNGIWGFGSGSFSDTLVKQGLGPLLYSPVASSGRNYHSMSWDVNKPGDDPRYDTMNKTGTGAMWWLDWTREYGAWKRAGLPVAVTFQFSAKTQPPSSWSDPYSIAYTLGLKFARHFGPTAGTGNVASFEAGNEPWDYTPSFYQLLLRGFIEGVAAGDPAIKRLPCALQANDPLSVSNYIGAMVPDDVLPKLDALNTHTYSLAYDAAGVRRGVHPEAPDSSFNAVNNLIRWRDANAPGTPVWVTEWGWDAARPTETCGTSTECVSQQAQAAYAIRGLSLLARKGVAATHWFFYANDEKCETLFCRSGLRDTYSRAFAELPVYRALKAFLQLAGPSYFLSAPEETSRVHVHVLAASQAGAPSHVLVWRPVPVGLDAAAAGEEVTTFTVGPEVAAAGAPTQAWRLSGALPDGRTAAPLPTVTGTSWSMLVGGIPMLVVLGAASG